VLTWSPTANRAEFKAECLLTVAPGDAAMLGQATRTGAARYE
jgi:hypothetical protein